MNIDVEGLEARLDHPQRRTLNDEVHARPPDPLSTPSAISYIARFSGSGQADQEFRLLAELLKHFDLAVPPPDSKHCAAEADGFRLRWERHTEFSRYAITVANPPGKPFENPPITLLPAQWLQQLEGTLLVGIHASLLPLDENEFSLAELSAEYFTENVLVGAQIAGGAGIAVTDFRIHEDGFSRMLLLNEAMNVRQSGRFLLRLLEIETYRMMALLALPVAQAMAPKLNEMEQEVAAISAALAEFRAGNDQALLDRIIHLAAQSEASHMRSQFRFAAAEAYNQLVRQRINELREVRLPGLQNFEEFYSRRLTPAVQTCRSTAARQVSLSDRTTRATQLLSTRVDVERQRQNQSLLSSMNQRAEMQLRLQATVEGLSVAAITYYVVGLIYYLLNGAESLGWPVNPSLLTAVSIPPVALLIFGAVRRVRRHLSGSPS
jgi:uncharacterized membrane-anchored protein